MATQPKLPEPQFTSGPWFVQESPSLMIVAREGYPVIAELTATDDRLQCGDVVVANAHLIAKSPDLYMLALQYRSDLLYPPSRDSRDRRIAAIDAVLADIVTGSETCRNPCGAADDVLSALAAVTDLFAHPGENSVDRFERLAGMFRADTGFLAPGKDQPMGGADQPDGDELRAIYDGWYQGKIDRARVTLAKARGDDPDDCEVCDGEGRIWNNADPTSGQYVECEVCGASA